MEEGRIDIEFPDKRHALADDFDRGSEHEVVGDFNGGGCLRLVPGDESSLCQHIEDRLELFESLLRAAWDYGEFAFGREVDEPGSGRLVRHDEFDGGLFVAGRRARSFECCGA